MGNLQDFNPNEVEDSGFDVLPAGNYRVCITSSEMKPTKAGTGTLINLTLQVLDGQYQNRLIFDRINYINPNPTAQSIGRQTLKQIYKATGVEANDTSELHNIPMVAKVIVKRSDEYGEQNEVKGYTKGDSPSPAPQQAPQAGSAGAWANQVRN